MAWGVPYDVYVPSPVYTRSGLSLGICLWCVRACFCMFACVAANIHLLKPEKLKVYCRVSGYMENERQQHTKRKHHDQQIEFLAMSALIHLTPACVAMGCYNFSTLKRMLVKLPLGQGTGGLRPLTTVAVVSSTSSM